MTDPRQAWRRAGRGLTMMGFGIFLLFNTTGYLPWSFWLRLLPLWPVLLIAIGLRMVFQRSAVPAGMLLAPLLVLGTMTWVAVAGSPEVRWDGSRQALNAARPAQIERWTLEGTLAYGRLDVAGGSLADGTLVEGEGTAAQGRPQLRTSSGGHSLARVRFRQHDTRRIMFPGRHWAGWRLNVADDLPLTVDLEMALAEAHLNLAAVPLSAMDIDGAFNDIGLELGVPRRDVTIRLDAAFSGFEIRVPEGVPVDVRSSGFMNATSGVGGGEGPGYRIRLEGAFNRMSVRRSPLEAQSTSPAAPAATAAASSPS